jgi:hypothetical protein
MKIGHSGAANLSGLRERQPRIEFLPFAKNEPEEI